LGTPTEETWPGHTLLPDYVQFKTYIGTPLADIFTAAGPDLISLLDRFLALDPNNRCTCAQALQMEYFRNKPYPSAGAQLPLPAAVRERLAGGATAAAAGGVAGTKRKMRDGLAESGLAKRLVF
jgi:cyclin-dependent kinase 7